MLNQSGSKPSDILPEVLEYAGPDRVVSSLEYAEVLKQRLGAPRATFTSGIKTLDDAIKGFQPGELIVVSGPTGMGKTLFIDTTIRSMREAKSFSLFFSFEVTPETVVLAHSTPETVLFLPLEHVAMDLEWIRWRCLEAKMKFNCQAVFIDHLHYLLDLGSKNNMSLEIGRIMRFLKKDIALAMNLAVFIVCHVKQLDMETEPSIYHLRDSSFVAQEADTVLMIWRRWDLDFAGNKLDSRLQGLATLAVQKARRTGVMGLKIKIKKDGVRLVESLDEPEKESKHGAKNTGQEWWNK